MVVIGVDAHKRSHTLVAADEAGRKLAEKTVPATPDGHLAVVAWAAKWPERTFALEDCRHLTRRLEIDLLLAGEAAVRVPPHLMAGVRNGGRERGKSDPIDALAIARAALREPDLPVVRLDGEARELRLLVDHREDLVAERGQAYVERRMAAGDTKVEALRALRRRLSDQVFRRLLADETARGDVVHEELAAAA